MVNAKLTGQGWKGNVYGQYYDWDMFSNPVYANPDGTSAQIHQFDKGRVILGLRAEKSWDLGPKLQVRVGTENRYDDVDKVGVAQTSGRKFVSSFGFYAVKEASAALFGMEPVLLKAGVPIAIVLAVGLGISAWLYFRRKR